MLRRFVLVGLMVLAKGSMLQLVTGTLLSAMFLFFQVQAAPYVKPSDDFLASVAGFSLVIVFVCSYAFKDYQLVGLADVRRKSVHSALLPLYADVVRIHSAAFFPHRPFRGRSVS